MRARTRVNVLAPVVWCGLLLVFLPMAHADDDAITVAYSGKLLGYARVPDQQPKDGYIGCPQDSPASPVAARLLTSFASSEAKPPSVLVGIGDNFSPELDARRFSNGDLKDYWTWDPSTREWIPNAHLDKPRHEALLREILAGHTEIPYDNVACFFKRAGYTALVPGKHDFYYGPERLRTLARFLATQDSDGLAPVHMLAANLIIETRDPGVTSHRPFLQREHPLYAIRSAQTKIELPEFVLPWMRDFTIRTASDQAWVCEGLSLDADEHENSPYDFKVPGEGGAVCRPLTRTRDDIYSLGRNGLKANWHYAVCVRAPLPQPFFCAPFTVRAPFFQYQHAPTLADRSSVPAPYALRRVSTGEGIQWVAVFGVVDPDLPEHIGSLNYSWTHVRPHDDYETSMRAMDPKLALQQLMQECRSDDRCRTARKVLLAQMSPSKAAQLVGRLRAGWTTSRDASGDAQSQAIADADDWFALVLSEADEELATGAERRTKTVENRTLVPFLVVPEPIDDLTKLGRTTCGRETSEGRPRCVRVTAASAKVDVTAAANGPTWSLENRRTVMEVPLPLETGDGPTLLNAAVDTLHNIFPTVDGPMKLKPEEALQQLVLEVMRRRGGHADVAMMQRRDLFLAEWHAAQHVDRATLQSILDRVFWKGDVVLNVPVTGATLKQMMKHSQQYQSDDDNSLSTTDERGRALITIGLLLDPQSRTYFVNGQPIEDARMYGVAVTDFVGEGDTGYSELTAKPPVPPDPLRALDEFIPLSIAVCQQLEQSVPILKGTNCHVASTTKLKTQMQLDSSDQRPSDTTAGAGAWATVRKWFKPSWPQSPINEQSADGAVEDRAVWRVILDKAQIGYSKNSHPDPQAFAGISLPPVTSPASGSISYAYQVRAIQEGRHVDRFVNSEFTYTRETTVQSDKPSLVNQKANAMSLDAGYYVHLLPRHKQPGGLKLILGGRGEIQPVSPLVLLPPPASFEFNTKRKTGLFGRLGLRLEGEKRWIEAGLQGGELFNSVYQYDFGSVACPLSAGNNNLAACLKNNHITAFVEPTILARNRAQWSAFLSAHAEVPLPFAKLVFEEKAQFVRDSPADTSLDTDFINDATASMKVPIWGNLSLAPKLEWIRFENKVNFDRIDAIETAITLEYRFDWHRGVGLGRALHHANPPTTAQ